MCGFRHDWGDTHTQSCFSRILRSGSCIHIVLPRWWRPQLAWPPYQMAYPLRKCETPNLYYRMGPRNAVQCIMEQHHHRHHHHHRWCPMETCLQMDCMSTATHTPMVTHKVPNFPSHTLTLASFSRCTSQLTRRTLQWCHLVDSWPRCRPWLPQLWGTRPRTRTWRSTASSRRWCYSMTSWSRPCLRPSAPHMKTCRQRSQPFWARRAPSVFWWSTASTRAGTSTSLMWGDRRDPTTSPCKYLG